MSDVLAEPVIKSPVYAEATITPDTDEADIFTDIAATALAQTKRPLTVALVQRWPQPGATIVRVTCSEDSDGTRTTAALARQIGKWEPVE